MSGDNVAIEKVLLTWLKNSYTFHSEYWKESSVPELQESEKIQEKVVLSQVALV